MPIDLIDTIKPKNNGTFPMVEAEDVVVGKGTADEKRLPEALGEKADADDIQQAIADLDASDISAGAQGTRTFDTAAGADNWGTAWGVALNLSTLDPDGGGLPGAGVRVSSITLRTSASSFTNRTVRLLLRAADGTETSSENTVTPTATSQEMAFAFAGDGAPLPGGSGELFFTDEDAEGEHVPVSLRILAVGAQPEGNAILIASSGARRADLFPELSISYSVQGTVMDAIAALAIVVAGGVANPGADNDFSGTNLFRGIARMANLRVSVAPDDATKDIALVPNADGAGLQLQFPGGNTAMIRSKTGVLATTAEVKAKQDALTAGENISIQGGVISSTAKVAVSPYGGLGIGENGLSIVGQEDSQGNISFGNDLMFRYQQNGEVLGVSLPKIAKTSFSLTTTAYVNKLVGDINAALAQI